MVTILLTMITVVLLDTGQCYAESPEQNQVKPKYSQPLQAEWYFRKAGQSVWYPAEVPGCVHMDLMRNRLIEDPFSTNNEESLQ
jgi:glycosyl hydrolase family 2